MKLFIKRLLWLLPIPLLIILVNLFADPANLFNEKYEKEIAGYLVSGYHVTDVLNYNERLFQKYFIEEMKECPSGIVLGASTLMLINSSYVSEKPIINNGVSGATLEDYLAIYYLYEKKRCKIKKILLGLYSWHLNENNDQDRWKALGNEYEFLLKKINGDSLKGERFKFYEYAKYAELISVSYFKTSLNYLMRGVYKKCRPTKNAANEGLTKLNDGAIIYDAKFRNATSEDVLKKAKNTVLENPIYSLGGFTHLSDRKKEEFEKFVLYLQNQNVEVEFYLSPYHPIVYDYFKTNSYYQIVFDAEKYFRGFAANCGIKVIGSYDPDIYHLDNSFFYDGYHCKELAIKMMMGK